MKLLGKYTNGNYKVFLYSDGTKVRETDEKSFVPAFAENCDVKITDYCDGGCPWCYEGCSTNGKHADLFGQEWINTLHPYTELALNGNDLSHPQLIKFLEFLKGKQIITNMTVNQKHFMKNIQLLQELTDKKLIYGLGVSLVEPTQEFLDVISKFPNAVVHTIAGILTTGDIEKMQNHNIKLLILGYKSKNRGKSFFNEQGESVKQNQENLKKTLPLIKDKFNVISFDNLALEQLDVKNTLDIPDEAWQEIYMGDDGKFTFYIDMVNKTFAKNSVVELQQPVLKSVDEMFATFSREKNK